MSDDTQDPKPKNNVLSLVSSTKKVEVSQTDAEALSEKELLEESKVWAKEFMDGLIDRITTDADAPLSGVCVIITHEGGGVSHAHKCTREALTAMIGSLQVKATRLSQAYDQY